MRGRTRFAGAAFVLMAQLMGAGAARAAAQGPAPYRLSLQDAIEKALAANVNGLVAGARVEEAEGTRMRRDSAWRLPRVSLQSYANSQNRNLRAFGISFPGTPDVVGPFSNYDFRVYAQQNLIDRASAHGVKAAERTLEADKLDVQDARDQIVRLTAGLYLNGEAAAARVEAAQSRVRDADALLKLARDRHDAGTATGVDVLRAEVQRANDRQALLLAQNQLRQGLLELARDLGMSPGTPLELGEALRFEPLTQAGVESLAESALAERADYRSLASQRQSLEEQQKANHARWLPKLSVNGNYGGIGRSLGGIKGTGLIQGQVDFTLFDRDRDGEAVELASRRKALEDRIADLKRGVEEEIREALLNLDSAAEQVSVAAEGRNWRGGSWNWRRTGLIRAGPTTWRL